MVISFKLELWKHLWVSSCLFTFLVKRDWDFRHIAQIVPVMFEPHDTFYLETPLISHIQSAWTWWTCHIVTIYGISMLLRDDSDVERLGEQRCGPSVSLSRFECSRNNRRMLEKKRYLCDFGLARETSVRGCVLREHAANVGSLHN